VRFRKAAKATQSRYGRINQLAIDENGADPTISARIETQRNGTFSLPGTRGGHEQDVRRCLRAQKIDPSG